MAVRTNLMKKILDIRLDDPVKEKELCIQLLENCGNPYTEAFGRTYLGDAYHTFGQIDNALSEYKRALVIAEEKEYDDLLSVLYNSIGVLYMYNDDEQSALDYFFDGMELAKKINDKMMQATLWSNIAYVYRDAGAFDKAENKFEDVKCMISEAEHNDANVEINETAYMMDKIWMMLQQGQVDEAWELMQDESIVQDTSNENYINYAIYYMKKKEKDLCEHFIDMTLKNVGNEINRFNKIIYYQVLIEVAIEAGLFLKAEQILFIAEQIMNEVGTIGKWVKLMDYRIKIYKALGKTKELDEAYDRYYEYDMQYEEQKQKAVVARVRRKIELLVELDRKNKNRQKQADLYDRRGTDTLTGLYNRWGFNARLEDVYSMCKEKKLPVVVAITDVDFFKEYNDTYGHIAGDKCLKTVAAILNESIGEHGIEGRYGGDEFIIAMCCSKDEAETVFAKIKAKLAAAEIANSGSEIDDNVTITTGAVVADFDESTDFIYYVREADLVLYEIKKSSKNGYKVRQLEQE